MLMLMVMQILYCRINAMVVGVAVTVVAAVAIPIVIVVLLCGSEILRKIVLTWRSSHKIW